MDNLVLRKITAAFVGAIAAFLIALAFVYFIQAPWEARTDPEGFHYGMPFMFTLAVSTFLGPFVGVEIESVLRRRRMKVQVNDIVGHQVHQVIFSAGPYAARLVLRESEDHLSEIDIDGSIKLERGEETLSLTGAMMGRRANPRELAPLLALLTETITAVADAKYENSDGEMKNALSLTFSNQQTLIIGESALGSEGWTFRHGGVKRI